MRIKQEASNEKFRLTYFTMNFILLTVACFYFVAHNVNVRMMNLIKHKIDYFVSVFLSRDLEKNQNEQIQE